MAAAPSQPSPAGSFAQARDMEARSVAFSAPSESIMLGLSSSEELDVPSIDAGDIGDLPAISPQNEELMEVVSRAVSKLNTEWPAEKQEALRKSKLDERFLQSTVTTSTSGLIMGCIPL